MGKINGTLVKLLVKRATDAEFIEVGAAISDTLSIDVDLPDASTKGSGGWDEHIQGMRSGSGSITGLHDPTETFTEAEVFEIIDARESVKIQAGTMEAGSKYFEFDASISNFTKNSEMESPVGFDFSYKTNGKPEYLTVSAT